MLRRVVLEVRTSRIIPVWSDIIIGTGPNNDQLFVTTAHCGANGGDSSLQEQYPDSGHVFRVDLSGKYQGSSANKFAG